MNHGLGLSKYPRPPRGLPARPPCAYCAPRRPHPAPPLPPPPACTRVAPKLTLTCELKRVPCDSWKVGDTEVRVLRLRPKGDQEDAHRSSPVCVPPPRWPPGAHAPAAATSAGAAPPIATPRLPGNPAPRPRVKSEYLCPKVLPELSLDAAFLQKHSPAELPSLPLNPNTQDWHPYY